MIFVGRISDMKTSHFPFPPKNIRIEPLKKMDGLKVRHLFFDLLFLFQGLVISVAHFNFLATSFLCWIPLPSNGNNRCGYIKSKALRLP